MAKKKTIMRDVLTCFIVFAILASVMPILCFAMNSSNNATEASNYSNDLEESFTEKYQVATWAGEFNNSGDCAPIPDVDMPVIYLNDTGATISPLVSNDARETVSAQSCDVYVKIDDDSCAGYEVYVDGVYQFTEGQSGTPDGYCAFYVTAGTHTLEIRKNGRSASKTINFQCGYTYRWVSMPDNWCIGGGGGTKTCINFDELSQGDITGQTLHYDQVDFVAEGGDSPYGGHVAVQSLAHSLPNGIGLSPGHVTASFKVPVSKVSLWVGDWAGGTTITLYAPTGGCLEEVIAQERDFTYYEFSYAGKIASVRISSSEGAFDDFCFEIGDATPCNVYVIIDDNTCTGYEVYVDGVYQFTEGQDGTPDGDCAFYVTAGTHTLEIRKTGRSATKTINFQCGYTYRWVSMPDNWCEVEREVKFRGELTGTGPEGMYGVKHWYVKVNEYISGALPLICDEIDVYMGIYPPMGSFDVNITKGDGVEVFGSAIPSECTVNLNGESYYIKRIDGSSCGEILEYAISDGSYPSGQKVIADMKYKSLLSTSADFKGVFKVRSPTGDIYTYNSKKESTPAGHEDYFGYNRGNHFTIQIPEDASLGWYDAKLELRNFYTDELCDETGWIDNQFKIEDREEIKFKGTAIEYFSRMGACGWTVRADEIIRGPSELQGHTVSVALWSVDPDQYPPGYIDPNIEPWNKVEVYGLYVGEYDVTLSGSKDYYIKKIAVTYEDWPMFRHDARHTGYSSSSTPDNNNIAWIYETEGKVTSSPVVANSKVFVGSDDGKIYCLDESTGKLIWIYQTEGSVRSSPAVANGKVFIGSRDHNIYCLNETTGKLIWSKETGDWVDSSPTVANGRVFVGSKDYTIHSLDENTGQQIWKRSTIGQVYSSPAVAGGVVYIGDNFGKIYALRENDGELNWDYKTRGSIESSPAVVNGKVYVGSFSLDYFYCFDVSGKLLWVSKDIGSTVTSSPGVANGKVFVGSRDNKIYCLNGNNGDLIWSKETGDCVDSSPAIADGKVFVGSYDNKIYALDEDNGKLVWSYETGDEIWSSSPAVANGKVFIGSNDGKIYAFGPKATGWSEDIRITNDLAESVNPRIAVDSNKNIHIVWEDERDGYGEIYYTKLDNSGNTLIDDKRITYDPASSWDPVIAVDLDNNVHVAWDDWRDNNKGELYFAKLDSNGDKVVNDKKLTHNNKDTDNPAIAIDSGNGVHLAWEEDMSTPFWDIAQIYYTKLDDNGHTLVSAKKITNDIPNHYFTTCDPAIAVDSRNNIHIVWEDLREDLDIFYTKLDNNGNTLVDDTRITYLSGVSSIPAIGIDSNDNIHITWEIFRSEEEPRKICYTKLDTNGNTVIGVKEIAEGSNPAVAIGSNNDIHIVWDGIFYLKLDNNGNILIDATKITQGSASSVYPDIVVDSNDKVHITWQDDRDGNWEIYYKTTAITDGNGYHFTISVTDSAGYNIEGAEVYIDSEYKGKTDTNGELKVKLTDGYHVVEAKKSGYKSGSWSGEFDHTSMNGVVVILEPAELPVHNLNTGKDFATIQAAIDDSGTSPRDTITADPGTYTENVKVTKSLTIKSTSGSHKDTIVQAKNPGGPVIEVTADDVTISEFTVDGTFSSKGIYLNSVKNCEISNNNCSGHWAIVLGDSSNNAIISNNCSNNDVGIFLGNSNNNVLTGNNVTNNYIGIEIGSSNNILTENTFLRNNWNGVYLQGTSSNNQLYHNNFISDSAYDLGTLNQWDNGYPSGGNYWSGYKERYPDAKERDESGIWDIPYDISGGAKDNYPLMEPWGEQKELPDLTFTQHARPSSNVVIGTQNVLVNTLDFTATGEGIKVDEIKVTLYGSGSKTNISDVKIYKETSGYGFYPVADTDISNSETADAWDGSVCTVTLGTGGSNAPQTIAAGDATWYIVFNIASTATDGHTVGGRIASGADISAKVNGETIVAQKEGADPTEVRTIIAPTQEPVPQIDSVEILNVNDVSTNIFTPGDTVKVKATISNPSQYRDYSVSVSMNIDDDTDGSNGAIYDSHLTGEDLDTDLPTGEQNSFTWSWIVPIQAEAEKTYYVAVGIHDQSNYNDICYHCPGYVWDFEAIFGGKKVLDVPYVTQGRAPWCLLASATMLLRYYGEDSDLWQNADWLDWNCDDGLLARLAVGGEIVGGWIIQHPLLEGDDPEVNYNFQTGDWVIFASDKPKTFGWIKNKINNNTPVIFFSVGIGHAVVIVGYDDDRGEDIVYVNDPSGYLVERSSVQVEGYDYNYPFIKKAVKWDKVLDIREGPAKFPGKFIFIDSDESQQDPVVQLHFPFSSIGGCQTSFVPSDYVLPTYVDYTYLFEGPPFDRQAHLVINEEGLGWDFPSPYSLIPCQGDYLHFKEVHITNSGQGRNYKAVFSLGENTKEVKPFYLGTGLMKSFGEIKLKLWNLDSGEYIPCIEIYVENLDGTYSSIKTVSLPSLSVVSNPFIATVFSPVDLTITDPDGFVINKESSDISNANYIEVDIDGDGDLDDQIIIPQRKIGNYQITVIPEPDAEDTDTYTLEVSIGNTTTVLAENVPISKIPAEHYIFKSGTSQSPSASFSYSPENPVVSQSITFDASSSAGCITNYKWDFGDGSYGTGKVVTHSYSSAGTYKVTLTVTDSDGAVNSTSKSVSVAGGLQQFTFLSTDNAVPITIDGTSQTSPYTASWTSGSVHSVNALSEFFAQPDCLKYIFTGWTGAITLSYTLLPPTLSPGTYTANYKKQYYLTVNTEPQGIATISGEGWYDQSAMATTGSAPEEVTAGGEKYQFETWKVDGSPVSMPFDWIQLRMDNCHTVTASYQRSSQLPPTNPTLTPDIPEPQNAGTSITWTASATDSDGDTLYYRFWIKGPSTGDSWAMKRDWSTDNTWTWDTNSADIGDTDISVWIRDGHHEPASSYDLEKVYSGYTISGSAPSLAAEWHFDEGSGSTVKDNSGNGNDGIIHGATWINGIKGNALKFDGKDDYVEVQDTSSLRITGNIKVEAWVKVEELGSKYHFIVSKHYTPAGYTLFINPANKFAFEISSQHSVASSTTPEFGQWYHVVGTYDQSQLKIYVNDVLENTKSCTAKLATNNQKLRIGQWSAGGYCFKGIIDEVGIYANA